MHYAGHCAMIGPGQTRRVEPLFSLAQTCFFGPSRLLGCRQVALRVCKRKSELCFGCQRIEWTLWRVDLPLRFILSLERYGEGIMLLF